ncbi:MAG: ABC transporter ATP-binding protein [Desulfovibrio sp.]|nr:ABC transporter ATP-binding protein [Desulfovibrio sp.]|tara:strand:+ start:16138 stop:17085 length:948 start_codon:yes stop_codon:yes gene_type:complete
MFLRAEKINKSFNGTSILHDIDFTVDKGSVTSFIGPSGVGKTTMLKMIAGLESPDSGHFTFGEPPSREHPVILVFQDYLLFPNLTVFNNVAFGLRARKIKKAEIHSRVMTLLEHFQLASKSDEYPASLSAGQQQRVALARAMVVNPAILLLDEPFANLDRNLKMRTAEFIRDTQQEFGVTTICVTHDQDEAFLMSDDIGVILNGKLAQFASARDVYAHPASFEVAEFLGPVNTLTEPDAALLGIQIRDGGYFVRPENLSIRPDDNGSGIIRRAIFAGRTNKYEVDWKGTRLTVISGGIDIREGQRVHIQYQPKEK